MEYKYIGCFIDYDALHKAIAHLPQARLAKVIEHPHVTFAYRPDCVDTALFGEPIALTVVGYGNDGINEGLLVEVQTKNAVLQAMADDIAVPHITLSISEDGKAVNTAKLTFSPIAPFGLCGHFGGYRFDDGVDTQEK